jgi:hypothetical protein
MVVAVVTEDGLPRAVPVKIQHWDGVTFEWDSMTTAVHSKAIAVRPIVSICIYRKASSEGDELVVYGTADVMIVSERSDSPSRYRAVLRDAWLNSADHIKRELDLSQLAAGNA